MNFIDIVVAFSADVAYLVIVGVYAIIDDAAPIIAVATLDAAADALKQSKLAPFLMKQF